MERKKKVSGRPKMLNGKKEFILKIKLTKEEINEVISLAKSLGLNRTELIRLKLFKSERVLVNGSELLSILDLIGVELGRSGNNINQLARHANVLSKHSKVSVTLIDQYIFLLTTHNKISFDLRANMRQLIRLIKG